MQKSTIIPLYLMLLAFHVVHILEEVWRRFWLMNAFYGLGWFVAINWVLFCIPLTFFYFVLQEKRWAYYWSIAYAGIMIVNGIGHNVATLATGRYFDGFAGGYSGIGLLLIGLSLTFALWGEVHRTGGG